jgi:hypothetical protein
MDAPDYEAGFDLIASPARSQKSIVIVADIVGAVGTGLIGYSINIYTGSSPSWLPGHIAFLAGVTLTIIGIVLKYVVPKR